MMVSSSINVIQKHHKGYSQIASQIFVSSHLQFSAVSEVSPEVSPVDECLIVYISLGHLPQKGVVPSQKYPLGDPADTSS